MFDILFYAEFRCFHAYGHFATRLRRKRCNFAADKLKTETLWEIIITKGMDMPTDTITTMSMAA